MKNNLISSQWEASHGGPRNPGNNTFDKNLVTISDHNIVLRAEQTRCSEVQNMQPLSYGTYEIEIERSALPKNIILGVFLYQDDQHEVDFEYGRWNKTFNLPFQLVNQHPHEVVRKLVFDRKHIIRFEYKKESVIVSANGHTKEFFVKLIKPYLIVNLWMCDAFKSGSAWALIKRCSKVA